MAQLYSEIATHLAKKKKKGVYQAGERLPGVRSISRSEGVSPSTVVTAYRHLETEGYIEARPRSGFYVRPRMHSSLEQPRTSKPVAKPKPVTGQGLVLQLIQNINTPNLVQLGANVPDTSFLPTRAINRALSAVTNASQNGICGYEVPPGLLALRQQIAQRMVARGCITDPDDIVITSGCQEAVYLSLKSVTKPGDIVAIESPTYYGLLQAIDALGLKALEIPTHPAEGVSIDALQLALEQWPVKACVVVPNFSNPLGALMPDERKQALVALINQHSNVTLIEDDIYGDLNFEGKRPSVLKSFETNDNIIHCASHSKTVSAGLRIGWAISQKHSQQLAYEKFVSNCATSTVGQLTVAKFLASGSYDRHIRTMQITLMQNTRRLIDRIAQHFPSGTKVSRPAGGMTVWVELEGRVDTTELAHQALAQGISIAPGQIFSSSGGKYKNCLRLNSGVLWSEQV
ncbi:MAG: PLP-dependent aminotransferase family protein, partial [Halioglobus sp.]